MLNPHCVSFSITWIKPLLTAGRRCCASLSTSSTPWSTPSLAPPWYAVNDNETYSQRRVTQIKININLFAMLHANAVNNPKLKFAHTHTSTCITYIGEQGSQYSAAKEQYQCLAHVHLSKAFEVNWLLTSYQCPAHLLATRQQGRISKRRGTLCSLHVLCSCLLQSFTFALQLTQN